MMKGERIFAREINGWWRIYKACRDMDGRIANCNFPRHCGRNWAKGCLLGIFQLVKHLPFSGSCRFYVLCGIDTLTRQEKFVVL